MQLARSLFNGTQELVKLDLSYCGITSNNFVNAGATLFSSILELNLQGNPIMPEVCCFYTTIFGFLIVCILVMNLLWLALFAYYLYILAALTTS